jgi:hypothetical protein
VAQLVLSRDNRHHNRSRFGLGTGRARPSPIPDRATNGASLSGPAGQSALIVELLTEALTLLVHDDARHARQLSTRERRQRDPLTHDLVPKWPRSTALVNPYLRDPVAGKGRSSDR